MLVERMSFHHYMIFKKIVELRLLNSCTTWNMIVHTPLTVVHRKISIYSSMVFCFSGFHSWNRTDNIDLFHSGHVWIWQTIFMLMAPFGKCKHEKGTEANSLSHILAMIEWFRPQDNTGLTYHWWPISFKK